MNDSPRRGERGVSILGALVVALMLGAGSVATFELATPPLSSVTDDSQVASVSHYSQLALTEAEEMSKKARDDAEKAKKDKEEIAKQCKELLKKKLKAGEFYPQESHTDLKESKGGEGTKEVSRCVGVIADAGGGKRCTGMVSTIKVFKGKADESVAGNVLSKPVDGIPAGKCITRLTDPKGNPLSKTEIQQFYEGLDPETKKALADRIKGTALPREQLDLLVKAFKEEAEEAAGYRESLTECLAAVEKCKGIEVPDDVLGSEEAKKLRACFEKRGGFCDDSTYSSAEKLERDAMQKEDSALKNLKTLKENAADLGGRAENGPPGNEDDTVICKNGVCKDSKGQTVPPPSPGPGPGPGANNSTFPQGLQQLLGQQPPAGNQTPKAPGTCSAGQTLCSGNTLYSRNNQCVDTPVQYCQYGCAQSSGASSFLSFFGGSASSACAPAPQQGQNCPTAPQQPDPGGCQSGSWRPTYSGACVSGWQCVPAGGSGVAAITALLTCQPQVVDVGMDVAITYSCSSGTSEGGGFETGGARTGSTTIAISNPPLGTNTATFGLKCTDGSASAIKQCSVQIAKPAIVLVANPKIIPSGKTSAIGWVTSGMKSCVISSPTLQSFTDEHKNTTNVNGTVTTPPLTASADFVLKCTTLGGGTKEATTKVTVQ